MTGMIEGGGVVESPRMFKVFLFPYSPPHLKSFWAEWCLSRYPPKFKSESSITALR